MATGSDEVVIDTNVWVMTDADIEALDNPALIDCALACRQHLTTLRDGAATLVVDDRYLIIGEYRHNILPNGPGSEVLNLLVRTEGRILAVSIALDDDGYAILPANLGLAGFDPSDRKFVAVALARNPRPPIINATDTDWSQHGDAITAAGLTVVELCPQCVAASQ